MPISFGSVGDIISICLIVKDLVAALDESGGSSKEYQGLKRELWALERALLEVELLCRSNDSNRRLNALYATARKAAKECRIPVEALLRKIKKYGTSLAEGRQRSVFRDAAMKVKWQILEKDEIVKFQAEISAHSSSINMLLATANVALAQENHDHLSNRLEQAENKIQEVTSKQNTVLVQVKERLEENILATNSIADKVKDAMQIRWISQLRNELKGFMQRIITMNIATYNAVITLQASLSGNLTRSLIQEPFILLDAIGRISPVHMDFINSWEAFDAVLDKRFQNLPGHQKIKNNEYTLQEHATRREITRTRPWEGTFLPGQKVEMSLNFNLNETGAVGGTSCPSCHRETDDSQQTDVLCKGCGIWFRRITEFFDLEPPKASNSTPLHKTEVKFGVPSFSNISYGPKPPAKFGPASSKKRKLDKTNFSNIADDDISLFKRIRLISKKRRSHRPQPGPFSYKRTGNSHAIEPTSIQEAEEQRLWQDFESARLSLGEHHPATINRLGILSRQLHNNGKCSEAENLLREAANSCGGMLLKNSPEILQHILVGLMAVLVAQQKLDAAEELWESAITSFKSALGDTSTSSLVSSFQQVHPFRGVSITPPKAVPFPEGDSSINERPAYFIDPHPWSLSEKDPSASIRNPLVEEDDSEDDESTNEDKDKDVVDSSPPELTPKEQSELEIHMRSHVEGELRYPCSVCDAYPVSFFGNILQAVSFGGSETLVRIYIREMEDVNAEGGFFGNALQAASFRGHEAIVRILLENSACVFAQGGEYNNALEAASIGGHETVVKILLESLTYVNSQGVRYSNMVEAAFIGGHKAVTNIFRGTVTVFDAQGNRYDFDINLVKAREVVKILLAAAAKSPVGASINPSPQADTKNSSVTFQ